MARSLAECSSSFFRYHYTKGADAAAAAAFLSVTLREATKRRPFASSIPPRAEWSQNNLLFIGDIRSHSNPGNRFLPSRSFAVSSANPVPRFSSAVSLSFAWHTIIFTAWNPRANNACAPCTRESANRCTESRNLVGTCAAVRSRRERDVGVIVRLNPGKSAECFRRGATDDSVLPQL